MPPRLPARAKSAQAVAAQPQPLAAAAAALGAGAVAAPVGPVEAAPPKARELWTEGTPAVGAQLQGRCYYYGGREGASVVSWVAVDPEGETVVLKPPTPAPPPPPQQPPGDGDGDGGGAQQQLLLPDDHPRALRLTAAHAGCLIKFKLCPVRADGEAGHTESSRPTAEVAAAAAAPDGEGGYR